MCLFYLTSHKNRIGTRKEPEEGIKKKKKVKASVSFARYLSKSPKTLSKKCNFTNWAVKKEEKNSFLIDKNLMQAVIFLPSKSLVNSQKQTGYKNMAQIFLVKIIYVPSILVRQNRQFKFQSTFILVHGNCCYFSHIRQGFRQVQPIQYPPSISIP